MLMDEPTNHLDIPSCRVLEQALKNYEGTLVLITHDRRLMNEICTGILEIERGKTEFYLGTYDEYLDKKAKNAAPEESVEPALPMDIPPKITGKHSRKAEKRKEAKARQESARKKAPLLEEVGKIEKELARKDSRIKEIQSLMADPANYEDRQRILPLIEEEPVLSREIEQLEARWEELQTELEAIEKEMASG
jgi:ATP-binding cassette subfamily F protein 3